MSENTKEVVSTTIKQSKNSVEFGRFSSDAKKNFNTYRNFDEIKLDMEPLPTDGDAKGREDQAAGIKSLFNPLHAVIADGTPFRQSINAPLLDTPANRQSQRQQMSCTIADLVNDSLSGTLNVGTYDYSDFAYCKYLGKIPNNYLITLRRFPFPCGDHIDYNIVNDTPVDSEVQTNLHSVDVGRMVTWMGTPGNEMNNILKYSVKMNWEEKKSDFQNQQGQTDQASPLAAAFAAIDPAYQQEVLKGYSGSAMQASSFFLPFRLDKVVDFGSTPYSSNAEWEAGQNDSNKVYGPKDVTQRVQIRGRGLELEQEFSLVFDYQLRSYDGINGKSAMLDLLGNILTVCYNTGDFWGGAYRGFHSHQSNIYANLPIWKLGQNGDLGFGAVTEAIGGSISDIFKGIKQAGGIVGILKGLGGMLLGGMLNKLGRPAKMTANSLLSNAPTGMWHLTIGNPKSPIIEVGNLIMTDAEIEHYGPLGIDDFPTGLKVTVKLKHALDKDRAQIERMYNRGDNRIYVPMNNHVQDLYSNSKSIANMKTVKKEESKQQNKTTKDILNEINNGIYENWAEIKSIGTNIGSPATRTLQDIRLSQYTGGSIDDKVKAFRKTQVYQAAREIYKGACKKIK